MKRSCYNLPIGIYQNRNDVNFIEKINMFKQRIQIEIPNIVHSEFQWMGNFGLDSIVTPNQGIELVNLFNSELSKLTNDKFDSWIQAYVNKFLENIENGLFALDKSGYWNLEKTEIKTSQFIISIIINEIDTMINGFFA